MDNNNTPVAARKRGKLTLMNKAVLSNRSVKENIPPNEHSCQTIFQKKSFSNHTPLDDSTLNVLNTQYSKYHYWSKTTLFVRLVDVNLLNQFQATTSHISTFRPLLATIQDGNTGTVSNATNGQVETNVAVLENTSAQLRCNNHACLPGEEENYESDNDNTSINNPDRDIFREDEEMVEDHLQGISFMSLKGECRSYVLL